MDVLHGSARWSYNKSAWCGHVRWFDNNKAHISWNVRDIPVIMALDAPPYGIFGSPKSPFLSYRDIVNAKTPVRIALAGATFIVIPLIVDFDKKEFPYKFARFKGVEDAKLAVLAGNADLTSGALTGINTKQLKAGDMTLLWIYGKKRDAEFPNAPTHFELGMPKEWSDYALTRLIQVPPGTPAHIQSALREGLIKAFKDKRTIEWSEKIDTPVDVMPEAEFKQRINFLVKAFKENQKIVEAYYYIHYLYHSRRTFFIEPDVSKRDDAFWAEKLSAFPVFGKDQTEVTASLCSRLTARLQVA